MKSKLGMFLIGAIVAGFAYRMWLKGQGYLPERAQ